MGISKSTIVRTIMLLIVIINFVLEKCGIDIIPADGNTIMMIVEAAIEIATIVAVWWYNNSFSKKALEAQKFLEQLKESE